MIIHLNKLIVTSLVLLFFGSIAYSYYSIFELPEYLVLDTQHQLDQLDQVELNLQELQTFISEQRIAIKDREEVLHTLETEHESLRPVVEADRKVVEAIFKAQAIVNNKKIWLERLIGFISGVIASLLASTIFTFISRYIRKQKSRSSTVLENH